MYIRYFLRSRSSRMGYLLRVKTIWRGVFASVMVEDALMTGWKKKWWFFHYWYRVTVFPWCEQIVTSFSFVDYFWSEKHAVENKNSFLKTILDPLNQLQRPTTTPMLTPWYYSIWTLSMQARTTTMTTTTTKTATTTATTAVATPINTTRTTSLWTKTQTTTLTSPPPHGTVTDKKKNLLFVATTNGRHDTTRHTQRLRTLCTASSTTTMQHNMVTTTFHWRFNTVATHFHTKTKQKKIFFLCNVQPTKPTIPTTHESPSSYLHNFFNFCSISL